MLVPAGDPDGTRPYNARRMAKGESLGELAIVAVMGVTGSGKSNFLQLIMGDSLSGGPIVGHSLDSCTQRTERHECRLGNKQVVFFDTPGFDDTYRGDADILADVAQVLSSTYKSNLKLNGIIYLHRIKDERMTNAIMRNLTMFRNLCGDNAFPNVVLVTTFWDELQDETKGEIRERQLLERDEWWGYMAAKGSKARRFQNTRESALDIVSEILDLDNVTLQVQEEMVHRGLEVDQTTAGEALNCELLEQRTAFQQALDSLRREKEQARREHDVQLQEILEKMESEKEALLRDIENEQAALHSDRREERRRLEQEFQDERLRLERKVEKIIAESIQVKEETEAKAREDRRRLEAELNDKLYDFSEQQSTQMAQRIKQLEQRLAAEKAEGKRRLDEALAHSNDVIRDLKKGMERARREDSENYEEQIKSIEKRQRNAAQKSAQWMSDMERIGREILENRLAQQNADANQRQQFEARIQELEEKKKKETSSFWSHLGSLAGVGSFLLAALA